MRQSGGERKKLGLAFGLVAVLIITILGSIYLARFLDSKSADKTQNCSSKQHKAYAAIILDNKVSPEHINANLCDSLTIVNKDDTIRLVTFGPHEHHIPYDGITEKLLSLDESLTVTLVASGNYTFHDHLHDQVKGSFYVKPKTN